MGVARFKNLPCPLQVTESYCELLKSSMITVGNQSFDNYCVILSVINLKFVLNDVR